MFEPGVKEFKFYIERRKLVCDLGTVENAYPIEILTKTTSWVALFLVNLSNVSYITKYFIPYPQREDRTIFSVRRKRKSISALLNKHDRVIMGVYSGKNKRLK